MKNILFDKRSYFLGLLSWNTIKTECDLKEIENAIQNRDKSLGSQSNGKLMKLT